MSESPSPSTQEQLPILRYDAGSVTSTELNVRSPMFSTVNLNQAFVLVPILNSVCQGPVSLDPTCLSNEMLGAGSLTSRVAVAVFPVPPLVEVTFEVVLT